MIRVFKFQSEAYECNIASMSFNEAQKFVAESRELIAREKQKEGSVSPDEWNKREHDTVLAALKRAGNEITMEGMLDELDIPTLNQLYIFILEKSGLRPTGTPKVSDAGEVKAASTLAKSEAA